MSALATAAIDLDYEYFKRKMLAGHGIDLNAYKPEQMRRRIACLLQRHGVDRFSTYYRRLEDSPQSWREFQDFFTINVSEFFRDGQKFEELRSRVLPELLASSPRLRVWSAGCSNGSEPYSIALLLSEFSPGRMHQIMATDIDERILAQAKAGCSYSEEDIRGVPLHLRRHFTLTAGGRYALSPEIRQMVTFRQHDLVRDIAPGQFDLIVCRNVVIYFTDEAKQGLFRKFHAALSPNGVLFLGATEAVLPDASIQWKPRLLSFYQKIREEKS